MNTATRLVFLHAGFFVGGCGASHPSKPSDASLVDDSAVLLEASDAMVAWCPGDGQAVVERAEATLAAMTLEEKVAQMAGVNALPNADGRWDGIEDTVHEIPAFRMMDGPRGAHAASGDATAFPVGMARGATWSPELEERVAAVIATEVKAVGVNTLLAPTINVLRHPLWGRSQETYGEDPHHLGELGKAFVRGAQPLVLTQPKHFAVNSIEDTRFDVDIQIDDTALHEVYLPHFRDVLVDAGAASVMAAYNHVNGPPASESDALLTDILRDRWAFPGVAVSDWYFATETTEGSALAGLDVEMPVPKVFGEDLLAAVESGSVSQDVVDAAVRRILHTKWCFGLEMGDAIVDRSLRLTDDHLELAREVAERAAVLLQNQDLVPLAGGIDVAVTGRLADVENIGDVGSSTVQAPDVVTVWEGLRDEARDRTVSLVDASDTPALASADVVVVVVGLTAEDEGEGLIAAGDRSSLSLRAEDIHTIQTATAANDRVLVVLMGGGAITVEEWIDDTEAVVMGWYPGARGGTALARVVYGVVPPAGRLPLTVPRLAEDLPPFDNTSLVVEYDGFHGYRHLEREGTSARFPFGFGLSTTTFEWGEPVAVRSADDRHIVVSVDVTNTGERDGYETVQVYARRPGSDPSRAARALVSFGQVRLEPGQTEAVDLTVDLDDLAVFEAGEFELRSGTYTLEVGRSAEHTLDTVSLSL